MRFDNMREAYPVIANHVLKYGDASAPRGLPTREILGFQFSIDNPRDAIPYGNNRKASLPFAAVEAAGLISGRSNPDKLLAINPTMERFLEWERVGLSGGAQVRKQHGAYGPRIATYIHNAVSKLDEDRDSRQAIVTVWSPRQDFVETPDVPCTLSLQFLIRDDKMNMAVTMRSNDVWWGTTYDVFQFTQLQIAVANSFDIDVGRYIHTANSFHVYEPNFDDIETLTESTKTVPNYPETSFGKPMENFHTIQTRASRFIHDTPNKVPLTASEEWYQEKLAYVSPRAK